MVRHLNSHFTCAVLDGNSWSFIDDMRDNIISFPNIEDLFATFSQKWFFAVYVKNDTNFVNHLNTQQDNCMQGELINKDDSINIIIYM